MGNHIKSMAGSSEAREEKKATMEKLY